MKVIFILIFLIQQATALNCYLCLPSEENSCIDLTHKTRLEECDEKNETPYYPNHEGPPTKGTTKDPPGPPSITTEDVTLEISTEAEASTSQPTFETEEPEVTTRISKATEETVSTGTTDYVEISEDTRLYSKDHGDTISSRSEEFYFEYEHEPVYECYKVITEDNTIRRGCRRFINADFSENCRSLGAKDVGNCKLCSVDKCNRGFLVSLSYLAVISCVLNYIF